MGDLAEAIAKVVREPVELTGAGRTDAGVHGWGQVVSLDLPADTDLEGLARRINKLCAPDIAVRGPEWTAGDFDARFSAKWRRYRYRLLASEVPDPFLAATTWWMPVALDRHRMADAAHDLVGEHDFTSFCRRPRDRPDASLVRRVTDARWSQELGDDPRVLTFEITATAFCHQMVRSIVGTLVDIGRGRRPVGTVTDALAGADRAIAGQLAPPEGLFLWEVGY